MARSKEDVTPEDVTRGARLKAVRNTLGLGQNDVLPGKHQVVLAAEKGTNKVTGPLRDAYAEGLGLSLKDFNRLRDGELTAEQAVALSTRRDGAPAVRPRTVEVTARYTDEEVDAVHALRVDTGMTSDEARDLVRRVAPVFNGSPRADQIVTMAKALRATERGKDVATTEVTSDDVRPAKKRR